MKIQYTMMTMLILTMLGIGYLAYLLIYPFRTLDVSNAYAINTPKAGETLLYKVEYCKYTKAPATVFRTLHTVDETAIIPFQSVSTITVTGCNVVSVPLQLYSTVPPGEYYLFVDVVFSINAIRDIHYQFKTTPFKIL